jgi:hypothetical protein
MMLTPHKLFRRAFLEEHGLRFPEGRRRLEDHPFVLHAYFLSRGISVVADHPCYHWVKGAPGTHASAERYDPDTYFGNVREVLDLVESRTEPGPFRDRLLVHWYRGKMLGRVGGASFVQRDPDYRRGLVEAVRALQRERYPERLDAELPFHLRVRAHLLREGRIEGLEALSAFERQLRARVRLVEARGDGRHLALRVQGRLVGRDEPLVLRRRGERVVWEPPASLRDLLPQEGLDVTDDLEHAGVELYLYRDEDGTEWPLPMRSELRMEPLDGDAVEAVVDARASLSPTIAAAGAPLPAGEWEVRAAVQVAGFSRRRAVKRRGRELVVTSLPPGRIRRGSHAPPAMTRKRRVIRRLPRRLRRALAAAGRAARR